MAEDMPLRAKGPRECQLTGLLMRGKPALIQGLRGARHVVLAAVPSKHFTHIHPLNPHSNPTEFYFLTLQMMKQRQR